MSHLLIPENSDTELRGIFISFKNLPIVECAFFTCNCNIHITFSLN